MKFPLNLVYLLVSCWCLGVVDCLSPEVCWLLVWVKWWVAELILLLYWEHWDHACCLLEKHVLGVLGVLGLVTIIIKVA